MANIGFIGLGIMGAPMSGNLQKGGHKLFVYSHSPVPAELVSGGAVYALPPEEVPDGALLAAVFRF